MEIDSISKEKKDYGCDIPIFFIERFTTDSRALNFIYDRKELRTLFDFILFLEDNSDSYLLGLKGLGKKTLKELKTICQMIYANNDLSSIIQKFKENKDMNVDPNISVKELVKIRLFGNNINLFFPIGVLKLDERTENALLKNNIGLIIDILKLEKNNGFKGVRGLGVKGIEQIRNRLLPNLSNDALDHLDIIVKNNLSLIIDSPYTLSDHIEIIYSCFKEDEKNIYDGRIKINNTGMKTFQKLGKDLNLTHERVRQLYERVLEKTKNYFSSLGDSFLGNQVVSELGSKNYFSINKEVLGELNISHEYLLENLTLVFQKKGLIHPCGDNGFYYINDVVNDSLCIKRLFESFDKIYVQERKGSLVVIVDDLVKNILVDEGFSDFQIREKCKEGKITDILKDYLKSFYDLKTKKGSLILPVNINSKKKLIIHQMKILERPIHFKQLSQILLLKYPHMNFTDSKVHSHLISSKHAVNKGPGTYEYSESGVLFKTIVESLFSVPLGRGRTGIISKNG